MNINDATDKTSGEETGNQVWSVDLAHGQPTAGDFPSAVIRAITGGGHFIAASLLPFNVCLVELNYL